VAVVEEEDDSKSLSAESAAGRITLIEESF
jgi:hypothetical protein